MKDLLLGIDVGSGGCKISIIDSKGQFVASGTSEVTTYHEHPNWSEQNPSEWYDAVKKALGSAIQNNGINPADIIGIAVDAPTHNAVILDEEMKVIRNTIMWNDSRSFKESQWLMEKHGEEIIEISFNPPSPTWTLPQLLWVKNNEPEVHEKIRHIMFAKDYIRFMLTGTWETDSIDAMGSMFLDAKNKKWSKRLCELASLSVEMMPPIKEPHEVAGGVIPKAAEDLGLTAGTPVIVGTSDTAIECFAAGAVSTGQCVVKMATAATINLPTTGPRPSPKTATYYYVVPDMWYAIQGTNSAALSMRWFRDLFYADKENAYELIDKMAGEIEPGSNGLIFHPYLLGERAPYWDPNLRASFIGVSIFHKIGHFGRAVMEGVTFSV
ncbi:MAG: xylulokinase, partial [Calditrichaeota bacterium]|nr:xylulokinase [Calditrichota bacterium]